MRTVDRQRGGGRSRAPPEREVNQTQAATLAEGEWLTKGAAVVEAAPLPKGSQLKRGPEETAKSERLTRDAAVIKAAPLPKGKSAEAVAGRKSDSGWLTGTRRMK